MKEAALAEPLRLLVVEDTPDDAELALAELRRSGFAPAAERVETGAELRSLLARSTPDLILSDYSLPTFTGLEALAIARGQRRSPHGGRGLKHGLSAGFDTECASLPSRGARIETSREPPEHLTVAVAPLTGGAD